MNECTHHLINPKSASLFSTTNGQLLRIEDVEGKQVADLTALNQANHLEYLSMSATIDANYSLRLNIGDVLYSNHYRPMFGIIEDTVGKHDLLHPMCCPAMYDFQYGIKEPRNSCQQNLEEAYSSQGIQLDQIPTPINIFMNTTIHSDGRIVVEEPRSQPGDFLLLETLMDLVIGIAACSVEESKCNGYSCTRIGVEIINEV